MRCRFGFGCVLLYVVIAYALALNAKFANEATYYRWLAFDEARAAGRLGALLNTEREYGEHYRRRFEELRRQCRCGGVAAK